MQSTVTVSNADAYSLPGYEHVYSNRVDKIGGGVSLLIKDGIVFNIRNDLSSSTDEYECLWVEIDKLSIHANKNAIVGVI